MAALLSIDAARRARESARASAAELSQRQWRRSWRLVYAQCVALSLVGYAAYGLSWGLTGPSAQVLAAAGFLFGYVLPCFRLLAFFLRHADQF